ncbi:helix-turn-helix domain-containing protein [Mycolicibacterium peregrinum]|uniref:helix-turn-helix domain-containing protein n=1 Tax=Mycolicibacterium peregrinum TaxID=43304 RepID=UPI003AAF6CB9
MTADHPLVKRLRSARDDAKLSNRKVAELAGVSPATVDRLMNGDVSTKVENLDSIAAVLKVPTSEARELANLPATPTSPYVGPEESRLLTQRQRSALDELIRSVVATKGVIHALEDETTSGASPQAPQVEEVKLPNDSQGRPVTMGDLMFGAKPADDSVEQGEDGRDVAGGQ